MKGRFAPSPTGYIHLGNVWIALLSYVSTRQQDGTYVIRMEDIDLQRSKREYGEALLDDLEWLGFNWDEGPRVGGPEKSYWQSERLDLYDAVLEQFRLQNLMYPCFCNRARLQSIASAPHRGEEVHHYDGHCRHLSIDEKMILESQRHPSWRLCVGNQSYEIEDRFQGIHSFSLQDEVDDFVLRRSDGMYAYNLAVVVDDIAMGISEIIRGHDLLDTTGQQLFLYQCLQGDIPRYGHAPLLIDSSGYRLSKRQKSITIRELRALQWEPKRILGELAVLGGLIKPGDYPSASIEGLIECSLDTIELRKETITIREAK